MLHEVPLQVAQALIEGAWFRNVTCLSMVLASHAVQLALRSIASHILYTMYTTTTGLQSFALQRPTQRQLHTTARRLS